MRKYLEVNGKVVGDYDYDKKTYIKVVKMREHRMWKFNAYGIQETVIQKLKKMGCKYVLIYEKDTSIKFMSLFQQWQDLDSFDFGHGAQRFLPISEMAHKEIK